MLSARWRKRASVSASFASSSVDFRRDQWIWRTTHTIRAQVNAKKRRLNQAIRSSALKPGDIQKGARTSDKSDAVTPARVPPQSEARMIAGKKVRKGIEVPTKRKRSARTRAAAKAAASPIRKTRI